MNRQTKMDGQCTPVILKKISFISRNTSHIQAFPRFHQYQAGMLKCIAQGHSMKKSVHPARLKSGISRSQVTSPKLKHSAKQDPTDKLKLA